MDGILLFDKPIKWTSHDAVDFIRRRIGQRGVGHAGTLDPMATGLLVMLLGKATKKFETFSRMDKEYEAEMTLGFTTDTYDLEGKVLSTAEIAGVSASKVREIFSGMTGRQMQRPPAYSAVKRQGKKLYELARAGAPAEAPPKEITVYDFQLLDLDLPKISFRVRCSKGTYIRSLCQEAGASLGCGATLSKLVRTSIGTMTLGKALTQRELESLDRLQIESRLIPV